VGKRLDVGRANFRKPSFFILTQLLLELRDEEIQQLCVALRNSFVSLRVEQDIAGCSDDDFAAETALDLANVGYFRTYSTLNVSSVLSASMTSQRPHL
jgi:hypothetical protein